MAWRRVQLACLAGLTASIYLKTILPSSAHTRSTQVSWTIDVEPVMRSRCVGCHRPDGFAPMSLATYQDARAWASAIRKEVLERRMPPWPAASGFADYLNDRSLSQVEVDVLASWAGGGTPIGPPIAPHENHRAEVSLRPPDVVLTAPVGTATGALRRVELATGLSVDRWITAWEFRPGNASLVQQAVLSLVPGTVLGTWSPPEGRITYSAGVAQRIAAGARVVMELHYRRSASRQEDQSSIRLFFGERPSRERQYQSFPCGTHPIEREVDVLAVTPNASAARATMEVLASRPDGTIEPLTVVPNYHPQYAITYRLRTPVRLRRGSELYVRSSSAGCSAGIEFAVPTRRP